MEWFVTGDTHGAFLLFYNLEDEVKRNKNIGIIILGDAGWNFFLNKNDANRKKEFHTNCDFTVYCV